MATIISNSTELTPNTPIPKGVKRNETISAGIETTNETTLKLEIKNSANKKLKIIPPYPAGFKIKSGTVAVLEGKITIAAGATHFKIQDFIFKNVNEEDPGRAIIYVTIVTDFVNSVDNTIINFD